MDHARLPNGTLAPRSAASTIRIVEGVPAVAATLSFLLPGVGQLAVGARRRALVLMAPAVATFVVGVALVTLGTPALDLLFEPATLVALLVLNVVLGAYHLLVIVDAYRVAAARRGGSGPQRVGRLVLAALLVATLGIHGAIELVGLQAYDTLGAVFVPSGPDDGWSIPEPSFEPTASPVPTGTPATTPMPTGSPAPSSPAPSATPPVTPSPSPARVPTWAKDGRLDVLLIGSDAGPDRWSLRTDTMVVLSIEVATGRTALFGVPRNLVGVPLPPESAKAFQGGRFPGLLNALYVYAMGHPSSFPGGEARGFRAVTGAVQELVGVRLDSVVMVNLRGFVQLVDAVGGLWIDVREPVVDRNYPLEDGSGHIRLDIRRGCQLLDGRTALAYARSRHQDSDYGRMDRQQAVLVALAKQADPLALVPKVPELLRIAKGNLWTTIKRADVAALAELAAGVDPGRVVRVLFVPSTYPSHLDGDAIARIRRVVRTVFDGVDAAPTPRPTVPPPACP
jgi:LCP family protein required for cell wall assembly